MRGLAKLAAGPGNVALAERPEPRAAAGQVVVEVAAAGICGTDLHIFDDEYASRPPVTMGHEVSGVVVELGEGVDAAWRGARVVTETYFSTCGRCEFCRSGRINLCLERRSIGSFADGGFAPRVVLPARGLHRVPDRLSDEAAALCEPLACVCQALVDPPAVAPGDRVLVTGPGPIGLLAAQVARAAGGAVQIVGTAGDALRLEAARAMGFAAAAVEDEPESPADVVIECSGSGSGMTLCLQSVRRGGRYVQIGLAGKPVSVPLDEVCFRELVVSGANASTPASWRRALRLVAAGSVELAPLVSEVVPLAEWERAFGAARAGQGIKYVLDPRTPLSG